MWEAFLQKPVLYWLGTIWDLQSWKKAKKLGITILSEDEFLKLIS